MHERVVGEEEEPDRERDEREHDDQRHEELDRPQPQAPPGLIEHQAPAGLHQNTARPTSTRPTTTTITTIA